MAAMLLDQTDAGITTVSDDADDEEELDTDMPRTSLLGQKAQSTESLTAETSFSQLTETNADKYADNGSLVRALVLGEYPRGDL